MTNILNIIIPLAGPDIYDEKINIRYLKEVNNTFYIKYCIDNRFYNNPNYEIKYHFIILESIIKKQLIKKLEENLNIENIYILENVQKGAAYTIQSFLNNYGEMKNFFVDLSDVIFDGGDLDFSHVGAQAYYYTSKNKNHSYFIMKDNKILDSKEKKVISSNASVGLYYFSSSEIFFQGINKTIKNRNNFYKKNLFLSSLYSKECNYEKIGYKCDNVKLIYSL